MSASEIKFPKVDAFFKLSERQTSVRSELIAGGTCFLTIAYIFILVPSMLSQVGIDFGTAMTATVLTALYSTLLVAFLANYPFVIGPGVSMVAYIAYAMISKQQMPWQVALGITFLTGATLLVLNILKIRALIIQTVPYCLRIGTTSGIGLFLAVIGLKNAGLLVRAGEAFSFGDPTSFTHLMAAAGLIIITLLLLFRIPGAFFFGIITVWIISAFFGKITWNGFMSLPAPLSFDHINIQETLNIKYLGPFISLLFVALFDSTGSVLALAHRAGFVQEGERDCHIPRIQQVFMCDSTGTMLSGLFGTAPTSIYLESAAGIGSGGRSGLTSIAVALFFVALLFFPLL